MKYHRRSTAATLGVARPRLRFRQSTVTRRRPAPDVLYGDAAERGKHQRCIQALAESTAWPLLVIVPVYEMVLAEMRPLARITEYLPIFVSRRVRHLLRPDGAAVPLQASSSSSG
ncbi:DUF3562 domain-containing protein [Noviherbaspirillum sedimenti]|uniref:DUF3562 domain-containing protein n=1 Tax=Noviherbaspirillum sedimenti TaxID=2320865 RepID=A0A3A3GJN0_9BURK|nr:DUF3562 domain-containing protein [Noviherbaspirillum sedimenti]RJG02516.1 DUF3562 domain-containing protein [Noviherbaspirillum sedimenti]